MRVQVLKTLCKQGVDVNTDYLLGKVLGRGQFGTVRLAVDRNTQKPHACKTISKRKLRCGEDMEDIRREVQIMHHLVGHSNIVNIVNAYEDKYNVHIITELCAGGELFDRITERGKYSEQDAAAAVRTMLQVVAHCHSLGVIHRDLKPENFLLGDKSEDAPLKATDFGLSVFFKKEDILKEIVGSAFYVAPEVLSRSYGKEADIWSCGVILYILLSGVPPFFGDSERAIFQSIIKAKPDFSSDPWPSISEPAKDCVKRMLVVDPKKRATADQILQHEWMKANGVASDKPLDSAITVRIRKFATQNKLKKEALRVMAKNISEEEVAGLKELFKQIDADSSGNITIEELREAMKKDNSPLQDSEIMDLLEAADVDGDGTIDYEEFLAATLQASRLNTDENLKAAFEHFDADGSGQITKDELMQALKNIKGLSEEHINVIVEDVDRDDNGEIDYAEFVAMMRAENTAGPTRISAQLRVGETPTSGS